MGLKEVAGDRALQFLTKRRDRGRLRTKKRRKKRKSYAVRKRNAKHLGAISKFLKRRDSLQKEESTERA